MTVVYHYSVKAHGRYPAVDAYYVVEEAKTDIMGMIYTLKDEGWTSKRVAEETGLTAGYIRTLWNPKNERKIKSSAARDKWIERLDDLHILTKNLDDELDDFEDEMNKITISNGTLAQVKPDRITRKVTTDTVNSSYVQVKFNKTYKSNYTLDGFGSLKEPNK